MHRGEPLRHVVPEVRAMLMRQCPTSASGEPRLALDQSTIPVNASPVHSTLPG